ncbi:MAG: hypothetical protein EXR29_08440 [Betaproteobacteria bacterium]|nr:hypothetical protein [Betaproteobacteria bacterium]
MLSTIILLAGCGTADTSIRPFTTDGCSAFPDGTVQQRKLWRDCCVAHDPAYWRGGIYDERRAADRALETCVASVGEPAIAKIMLAGARVGGSPWWPTQFRWGYGWPWPRGYRPLTLEEIKQVELALTATLRSSP